MTNCIACGESVRDRPYLTATFTSPSPSSKLSGIGFVVHASCFRLNFPDRPRVELLDATIDEPDMVAVELTEDGWVAVCHECDRAVAMKAERDDAHLAAARHIARRHLEGLPA